MQKEKQQYLENVSVKLRFCYISTLTIISFLQYDET